MSKAIMMLRMYFKNNPVKKRPDCRCNEGGQGLMSAYKVEMTTRISTILFTVSV